MDTIVVIIVLITLLVLFGGAAWFFVRETGVENAKLWLTSPRQVRQIVTPFRSDSTASTTPKDEHLNPTEPLPRERETSLMLGESRLRELAEELRGELTLAAGRTRDFDARLTRIEEDAVAAKSLPETIDRSVQEVEIRTRTRISKLRKELHTVRKAGTPYAARRGESLADLYNRLARADAALAAVVNPMLLPGEPLRVPDVLFDDTLEWENWADVGERAFEFGEIFNQNRLLLEPQLASQVERFISTLREALTDTIYPIVRLPSPTTTQKAQLRAGLVQVVENIAPLRRELEDAYREISVAPMPITDDDEDADD
jgi:hypothetical protein